MEIGNEVVNATEGCGWVDKNISFGLKGTIGESWRIGILVEAQEGIFHGADTGSANRETGTCSRVFEGGKALSGNGVPLVVDGVLADIVNLDGVKGSDADLEGEVVEGCAVLLELLDELRGEVESGGGCGDSLLFGIIGVNGLVAIVVARLAGVVGRSLNIGWEWHDADAFSQCSDGFVISGLKANTVVAIIAGFEDLSSVESVQAKVTGGEGFFPGLEEAPPGLGIFRRVQEETLDFSAGSTLSVKAGFKDGSVIAEATCFVWKVFAEVVEGRMGHPLGGAVDDHKARGVPPGGRFLGNVFRREVIVKAGSVHGLK